MPSDPSLKAAWQRELTKQITEAAKRGESVILNQQPQQGAPRHALRCGTTRSIVLGPVVGYAGHEPAHQNVTRLILRRWQVEVCVRGRYLGVAL